MKKMNYLAELSNTLTECMDYDVHTGGVEKAIIRAFKAGYVGLLREMNEYAQEQGVSPTSSFKKFIDEKYCDYCRAKTIMRTETEM
jgi:hypothetical protein